MPRRVPRLGPQPFLNGVHVLVPTARHAAHDVHVSGAALTSLRGAVWRGWDMQCIGWRRAWDMVKALVGGGR